MSYVHSSLSGGKEIHYPGPLQDSMIFFTLKVMKSIRNAIAICELIDIEVSVPKCNAAFTNKVNNTKYDWK